MNLNDIISTQPMSGPDAPKFPQLSYGGPDRGFVQSAMAPTGWSLMHYFGEGWAYTRYADGAKVYFHDLWGRGIKTRAEWLAMPLDEINRIGDEAKAKHEADLAWRRAHPIKVEFKEFKMPIIRAPWPEDT
jgi:hypothetical protein